MELSNEAQNKSILYETSSSAHTTLLNSYFNNVVDIQVDTVPDLVDIIANSSISSSHKLSLVPDLESIANFSIENSENFGNSSKIENSVIEERLSLNVSSSYDNFTQPKPMLLHDSRNTAGCSPSFTVNFKWLFAEKLL